VYPALTLPQEGDCKLTQKHKKLLTGKTLKQIDQEFWDYILYLLNHAKEYSKEDKNEIIEDICEYYYQQSGGYNPPVNMLYAMGDFILDDVLSDTGRDKVKKTEYPILSFKQLLIRRRREKIREAEIIDFLTTKKKYNIAIPKSTDDKTKKERF